MFGWTSNLLPLQTISEETSRVVKKEVYSIISAKRGYVCSREGKIPELSSLPLKQILDHIGAQPSSEL